MTPCSELKELFFKRIEKDRSFFNYFRIEDEESVMQIANERADTYLKEAVSRIMFECLPSVDFSLVEDEDGNLLLNCDATYQEKFLIVSLMFEQYLYRDIAYLKCLNVNYTSTDLRVFDPSNARASFMNMYLAVCEQNKELIDNYKNTNRDTGKLRSLNFSDYDTVE